MLLELIVGKESMRSFPLPDKDDHFVFFLKLTANVLREEVTF